MNVLAQRLAATFLTGCFAVGISASAIGQPPDREESGDEGRAVLKRAADHMQGMRMRLPGGEDDVALHDRPLLTFGDTARANKNGSLWAFGEQGRPLAMLELYQGIEPNANWIHAVTLTGAERVKLANPSGVAWTPESTQIVPTVVQGVAGPDSREPTRLRQMKDLARRFSAHEFWDPDNSRYELRLLVQPVLRYREQGKDIQDGAAFVLAHGTNPELIVLIEALGTKLEDSRWHYSVARLGSAELHLELDGKEVWKQDRTPGVSGRPADPYWLFVSAAAPAP